MRRLIKGGRFALHRTFMYLLYDVLRLQRASLIRRLTPIPAKIQSICSVYITLWLMSRRSVVCKLQALYCSFCHGIPIARNFPTLAYIDSGDIFACFYRLFLPTTLPKTRVSSLYVLRNPSIDSIIIGGEERILKTIPFLNTVWWFNDVLAAEQVLLTTRMMNAIRTSKLTYNG